MKKFYFFIILFLLVITGKFYSLPEGTEFLYIPVTIESPATGYSGVCKENISANFLINPSLSAYNQTLTFFTGYAYIFDFPYFQSGISIPFYDLTFSLATKIAGNYNSYNWKDTGSYYNVTAGISKKVVNNFLVGINISFINIQTSNFSDVAYNIGAGFLYRFPDVFSSEKGFCFQNTKFGLSIDGIGKQAIYPDREGIPPLLLRTGFETTFFNTPFLSGIFNIELNYNFFPYEYFFSTGLDLRILKHFGIKAGYLYGNKLIGNQNMGFHPFNFGCYLNSDIGNTKLSIFYSASWYKIRNVSDLIHYIGLEVKLPDFDTNTYLSMRMGEERKTNYSFSPNFDRECDFLPFYLNVKTSRIVQHWELLIFDHKGNVVRKISDKNDEEYDIFKLFSKIFERKESLPIPSRIEWDGISDSGSVLPEGNYFAYFCLINGNLTNYSETNYICLDITPPGGEIHLKDLYFSPNGDGIKDELYIYPGLSSDKWTLQIVDKEGKILLSSNFCCNIPKEIRWNGKDEKGNPLPEGLYDLVFLGEDEAKNKSIFYVKDILLSLKKYGAYLVFNKKEISFSKDSYLSIKPVVFPENSVSKKYRLTIYSEKGEVVKTFEGNSLPYEILWGGEDKNNKKVKDGKYNFLLEVILENEERAKSELYPIIVDSSPPEILEWKVEGVPFSPDDDGENDLLKINLKLKDKTGVSKLKVLILDPDKRIFKTFAFENKDSIEILWNGRSSDGELVESAAEYNCIVYSQDRVGNEIEKPLFFIPTDVLVEKIDLGYRIRINNIEFEFDRYDILPKSLPIIKRISEILKKYPDYEIEIHGHTDNKGSENYNLNLSKKRAESVFKELVKEGIPPKRMKTKGFGFKYPIKDNSTEEGRRKNRRVEFILKKP